MKTILFYGMGADVSESTVMSDLSPFGPIENVQIVRDGNPDKPYVLVTMNIDGTAAGIIVSHVQKRWHNGHLITAQLMHDPN